MNSLQSLIAENIKSTEIAKNSPAHKRFQSLRHRRLANGQTLEAAIRFGGEDIQGPGDEVIGQNFNSQPILVTECAEHLRLPDVSPKFAPLPKIGAQGPYHGDVASQGSRISREDHWSEIAKFNELLERK